MIKIENVKVCGWEPAIRGMRNSWNSWGKSDSYFSVVPCIAANDLELMMRLAKSGSPPRTGRIRNRSLRIQRPGQNDRPQTTKGAKP